MNGKLLIVDCDGTTSKVRNPFFAIAQELSCYAPIKSYADEYLVGRISYSELVSLQNPVFRAAARRYANSRGHTKFGPSLFRQFLANLMGDSWVAPAMIQFLNRIRSWGYEVAMISSGWDAVVSEAAKEASITYWRANGVLFEEGEFSGTDLRVHAEKTEEFESAVRHFCTEYKSVCYLGDSEFDLIGMEFIHRNGGVSLVHERSDYERTISFPPYVLRFDSLTEMAEYLRNWK